MVGSDEILTNRRYPANTLRLGYLYRPSTQETTSTQDAKEVAKMIQFKSCPKCLNGDLEEKADYDGHYLRCMQCGKHLEPLVLQANEVLKWTGLIESATEPIHFSIQDAFNVYQARAAR